MKMLNLLINRSLETTNGKRVPLGFGKILPSVGKGIPTFLKDEQEFPFSTDCIVGDKRGQEAVCEGWSQVLVGRNRCLWTI